VTPNRPLSTIPFVGMASTPGGEGYWLANTQGRVINHGEAFPWGGMEGTILDAPITHIVDASGPFGYWLVAADGGTFAFDAPFLGPAGSTVLVRPVVGMGATADDGGYWFVASGGGLFSYGDAGYFGSNGGSPREGGVRRR